MEEFKNKNDYTVIVFDNNGFLAKYQYVNSPFILSKDLLKYEKFQNWTTLNVYVRRSRRFLGQFKRNSFIPHKPR